MSEFVKVAELADLAPGERLSFDFEYDTVAVFNVDGKIYAIADICTHDDGPLGDGILDGHEIICPRHGACFNLRTGAGTAPAPAPVLTYEVKIEAGAIYVLAPDD